jgi:hypothetical protein
VGLREQVLHLKWVWIAVLAAALSGAVYGVATIVAGSDGLADRSAPHQIVDDATAKAAFKDAHARAGFPAKVLEFFPTSANRLVMVDSAPGAANDVGGLRLIELVYESDETIVINGLEIPSTLDMTQLDVSLKNPRGDVISDEGGGYRVYQNVVSVDSSGTPTKVSYTAIGAAETIIMDFTGEQPSIEGLVRALESLRPVEE